MATNSSYKQSSPKAPKVVGNKSAGHAPKATGKTSCPGGVKTDANKPAGYGGPNLG